MRDARRLTIYEPFRSIFYAPQWVVLHGGDFAAEGLDVEVRTAGGGLTTTGALMDGHSEIALGGIRRSLDVADRAGPFLVHSAEVNQRNGFFLPRSGGPAPQQGARAASGGLCDRSRGAGGRRAASEKRLYVASSRVAESGVIGVPHEIKGEAVVCFVVLRPGHQPSGPLRKELSECVARAMDKALKPEKVLFTRDLPRRRAPRSCAA
jgi:hypothetical protein